MINIHTMRCGMGRGITMPCWLPQATVTREREKARERSVACIQNRPDGSLGHWSPGDGCQTIPWDKNLNHHKYHLITPLILKRPLDLKTNIKRQIINVVLSLMFSWGWLLIWPSFILYFSYPSCSCSSWFSSCFQDWFSCARRVSRVGPSCGDSDFSAARCLHQTHSYKLSPPSFLPQATSWSRKSGQTRPQSPWEINTNTDQCKKNQVNKSLSGLSLWVLMPSLIRFLWIPQCQMCIPPFCLLTQVPGLIF